jgi:hypothetical protein
VPVHFLLPGGEEPVGTHTRARVRLIRVHLPPLPCHPRAPRAPRALQRAEVPCVWARVVRHAQGARDHAHTAAAARSGKRWRRLLERDGQRGPGSGKAIADRRYGCGCRRWRSRCGCREGGGGEGGRGGGGRGCAAWLPGQAAGAVSVPHRSETGQGACRRSRGGESREGTRPRRRGSWCPSCRRHRRDCSASTPPR